MEVAFLQCCLVLFQFGVLQLGSPPIAAQSDLLSMRATISDSCQSSQSCILFQAVLFSCSQLLGMAQYLSMRFANLESLTSRDAAAAVMIYLQVVAFD